MVKYHIISYPNIYEGVSGFIKINIVYRCTVLFQGHNGTQCKDAGGVVDAISQAWWRKCGGLACFGAS